MTDKINIPANLPKTPIEEGEVCICFYLRKVARIITHIYDEKMRPLGYRATQINLLGVINQQQPVTVKALAGSTDADPTTLIRNLRVLERKDLVHLAPGEDRRERLVTITAKGQKVLAKVYPVWKAVQDQIAAQVGRERLHQLLGDLGLALEKVQKK